MAAYLSINQKEERSALGAFMVKLVDPCPSLVILGTTIRINVSSIREYYLERDDSTFHRCIGEYKGLIKDLIPSLDDNANVKFGCFCNKFTGVLVDQSLKLNLDIEYQDHIFNNVLYCVDKKSLFKIRYLHKLFKQGHRVFEITTKTKQFAYKKSAFVSNVNIINKARSFT